MELLIVMLVQFVVIPAVLSTPLVLWALWETRL